MQRVILSSYINLRTEEMFEILNFLNENKDRFANDFPACVHDIQTALQNQSKFGQLNLILTERIQAQIQKRLLIPGTSTKFIISFYIQVIKVFKFIDPSTVLLEVVQQPIREYLRSRKDTLRNIVAIILSQEDSDLYDQLGATNEAANFNASSGHVSSDEDEAAAEKWEPVAVKDGGISAKRRRMDIISTLVNIYGSPEKFI